VVKKDLPLAFGAVLKELRKERGLSQQALADYAEMDRAYISQLELGESVPSIITIFKIAEVLKIKPGELVNHIDQRSE
jgi:transcriptional regulator with XRE-family HTH domain